MAYERISSKGLVKLGKDLMRETARKRPGVKLIRKSYANV